MLSDTQAIFEQLADVVGSGGVKVIIENHDAWVHEQEMREALTAAVRMAAGSVGRGRDEVRITRIERQRASLARLVTKVPLRVSEAG